MCTITIDGTTLLGTRDAAGEVVRVSVQGTAIDCDELSVFFRSDSQGVDVGTVLVSPGPGGEWSAEFVSGTGTPLGVECTDKFTVTAQCVNPSDGTPCPPASRDGLVLRCEAGCPKVDIVVTPGDCNAGNTKRRVTFEVTVAAGAEIQYVWIFGDATPTTALTTGSGTFIETHDYDPGLTYIAHLVVVVPAGCTAAPDPIMVMVETCGGCPDNPVFTVRKLPSGDLELADEDVCLEPGTYEVGLSNEFPPGTETSWSVNDQPAGQDPSVQVEIVGGQQVKIEVVADKAGCPLQSEPITLVGCTDCPDQAALVLEKSGADQEPVATDEGCVASGDYVVRLIEPEGSVLIDWFRDDLVVPGEHSRTLPIRVEEGQSVKVEADVRLPGTEGECRFRPDLRIEVCQCGPLSLTVFDSAGTPVDPGVCLAPGNYTVRASGQSIDDEATERSWTVNNRNVGGNGTEQGVRVGAPVTASCRSGEPPSTTVAIIVNTPGCDERRAEVSLRPCSEFVFDICCQLLGTLVLFMFGLTVIAAALAFCPTVLVNPAAVAVFVAFGFWIFFGLLVVLVAVVVLWFLTCPPDWCRDLLPKLWQAAFIGGIAFIYFGSCPLCFATPIGSLLFWGIGLLLVGAGLLLWWILSCRPTQCLTTWRLLELGAVNSLIGAIEFVLGVVVPGFAAACVSPLAVLFLVIINGLLDALVLALPQLCNFNPFQPTAAERRRGRTAGAR